MKCKHEWRFTSMGAYRDDYYYCIHCLLEVKNKRDMEKKTQNKEKTK